jgi:hypothetical protein
MLFCKTLCDVLIVDSRLVCMIIWRSSECVPGSFSYAEGFGISLNCNCFTVLSLLHEEDGTVGRWDGGSEREGKGMRRSSLQRRKRDCGN